MTASTHLITANRLRDGAAVWLGDNARWVEYAASAARFDETVLEEQLAAARNGADVIDVRAVPAPLSYREQIRSSGPSVRADLGTQADHPPRPDPLPPPPSQGSPSPSAGIYRYDDYDRQFLRNRAAQFRRQVERRLSGELTEDEFKPFRLMNGLYLQLHGYMLRAALPYGVMSAAQLRQLAYIARHFDRGYGHFTTRQNIQFNWIRLEDAPSTMCPDARSRICPMKLSCAWVKIPILPASRTPPVISPVVSLCCAQCRRTSPSIAAMTRRLRR
jgi:sulfite reductase (NADPH) hemoprotein beta-component